MGQRVLRAPLRLCTTVTAKIQVSIARWGQGVEGVLHPPSHRDMDIPIVRLAQTAKAPDVRRAFLRSYSITGSFQRRFVRRHRFRVSFLRYGQGKYMLQENSTSISNKEKDEVATGKTIRQGFLADLREILTDLWQYRELLYQFLLRDIRVRYKQAVMGFGWALFMPAFIVLAGLLVKYAMAQLAGREIETGSIAGMAVKALPWAFFVSTVNFATNSLTGNMNLVTKIYFPREIFPLSATLAQAFDTLIGGVMLFIVLPLLGVKFSLTLLWFPILWILLLLLTIATALFFSCANLFFRDVKYIVQVLITFGIFFTPVFFEPTMFGQFGSKIMMLNPLAPLLEGFRLSAVQGHNLFTFLFVENAAGQTLLLWSPWYLAYSACWAVGGLVVTARVFHRLQFVFAEYI